MPLDAPRMWSDNRLENIQACFISSKEIVLRLEGAEGTDAMRSLLHALATRACALPIARGMMTLHTQTFVAREQIPIPLLILTGRTEDGIVVNCNTEDMKAEQLMWPRFHNGCAAGLRLLPLTTSHVDDHYESTCSETDIDSNNNNKYDYMKIEIGNKMEYNMYDVSSNLFALYSQNETVNNGNCGDNNKNFTFTENTMHTIETDAMANGDEGKAEHDMTTVSRHWVVYQTGHVPCFASRAGLILAAGLLDHLRVLQITDIYALLVSPQVHYTWRESMTIAVLLGLSCSFRGTANDVVFRCLTMHIQSLTPGVEDIEVSREVQTAALIGVGLLFSQHWEHSFLVEVMLTEMSRMPSDAHCSHREGYVLGAGYALGLLLLGKGNTGVTGHISHHNKSVDSDNKCNYLSKIEERLLHMIYGSRRNYAEYNLTSANNNTSNNNNQNINNYFHSGDGAAKFADHTSTNNIHGNSTNSENNNDYSINLNNNNNACRYKDVDFYEIYGSVANDGHFLTRALLEERSEEEHYKQNQQNQELPATHFTCTQVHEGSHYNSFISGHAAVMALGFMHLKTNNHIMAQRLAVGHRFVDVQRVTPLLALLRSLMSCLICWDEIEYTRHWLYAHCPCCLQELLRCIVTVQSMYDEHDADSKPIHHDNNNNANDKASRKKEEMKSKKQTGNFTASKHHSSKKNKSIMNIILPLVSTYLGLAQQQVQFMLMITAHIITGNVLALAVRYAGSMNYSIRDIILAELRGFMSGYLGSTHIILPTIQRSMGAYVQCTLTCAMAASVVMAGSGDLEILSILRRLSHRHTNSTSTTTSGSSNTINNNNIINTMNNIASDINTTPITTNNSITGNNIDKRVISEYGMHMATSMAIGLLFLGAGRLTLCTSSLHSTAALLMALYPCWPQSISDNVYHLQALRHFYVLAVQSRVLRAVDAMSNEEIQLPITLEVIRRVQCKSMMTNSHDKINSTHENNNNNNNNIISTTMSRLATLDCNKYNVEREIQINTHSDVLQRAHDVAAPHIRNNTTHKMIKETLHVCTPCLCPPLHDIRAVVVNHPDYYPLTLSQAQLSSSNSFTVITDSNNNNNNNNKNNKNESTMTIRVLRKQNAFSKCYAKAEEVNNVMEGRYISNRGKEMLTRGKQQQQLVIRSAWPLHETECELRARVYMNRLCNTCTDKCTSKRYDNNNYHHYHYWNTELQLYESLAIIDQLKLLITSWHTVKNKTYLETEHEEEERELISSDFVCELERTLQKRYSFLFTRLTVNEEGKHTEHPLYRLLFRNHPLSNVLSDMVKSYKKEIRLHQFDMHRNHSLHLCEEQSTPTRTQKNHITLTKEEQICDTKLKEHPFTHIRSNIFPQALTSANKNAITNDCNDDNNISKEKLINNNTQSTNRFVSGNNQTKRETIQSNTNSKSSIMELTESNVKRLFVEALHFYGLLSDTPEKHKLQLELLELESMWHEKSKRILDLLRISYRTSISLSILQQIALCCLDKEEFAIKVKHN